MRAALILAALLAASTLPASAAPPANVQAALADKDRPTEDMARDALRKPAEMVAFAEIRPGSVVIDFLPGGGYFSKVFAGAVGPSGHVYAMVPKAAEAFEAKETAKITAFAATHPSLSVVIAPGGGFTTPRPADIFWTAQNYHDLHIPFGPDPRPQDMLAYNKAVWAALKPGGLYVVVDHVANAGATDDDIKKLHRIDPAVIIREVTAAGFTLEGQDDALRNPADPHTANVFDPAIRGRTDQVVLKFRKAG